MIERIDYANWQCHRSLSLELDRVTVLVGNNDCGKSSCLRGLEWLALGNWDGRADEFITWGEGRAAVTVTKGGIPVERVKGAGVNSYLLNGVELNAGRGNVPDEVFRFLRLTQRNFQGQQDPAFWLSLGGPAAAVALNELFNLSEIDATATRIASAVRQARGTLEAAEASQRAAQNEERALCWTTAAHKQLKELETTEQRINDLDREIEQAEALLAAVVEEERLGEGLEEVLTAAAKTVQAGEKLSDLDRRVEAVESILTEEEGLCLLQKQLAQAERRLAGLLKDRCPLCGRE